MLCQIRIQTDFQINIMIKRVKNIVSSFNFLWAGTLLSSSPFPATFLAPLKISKCLLTISTSKRDETARILLLMRLVYEKC